jgi:FkbM family methyltransferase
MITPIFGFRDPSLEIEIKMNPWKICPKAGDLMMDIGANRGAVSALAALNGATVVAYEPSPVAFEILRKTIVLNQVEDRVDAVNAAIHLRTGFADLNFNIGDDERSLVNGRLSELRSEGGCVTTVRTISIEEALGDKIWDIVKVDIEGYEIPLFNGCPESVFRQIKFLTMEMHYNSLTSPAEYTNLIQRLQKFFCFDDGAPRDSSGMFRTIYARR